MPKHSGDHSNNNTTSTGDNIVSIHGNWQFKGDMVSQFDAHIEKSVPLYKQGHQLICDVSDFFVHPDSTIYEIGSSTGTLLAKLAKHNQAKPNAQFIGIDIEADMVAYANKYHQKDNISFVCDDILTTPLQSADMIICYYSVQFIPPAIRQQVIDKLYAHLNWGGALILFEKMRAPDARFQDIFSALYTDYKLQQGYSEADIINKGRSLKGVLEPFSTQGNLDLLKRADFVDITTVQKYLAFEGFLAIK